MRQVKARLPSVTLDAVRDHHGRHPRSFLDVEGSPDGRTLTSLFWCIECHTQVKLSDEDAEILAEEGVPWRTGTE